MIRCVRLGRQTTAIFQPDWLRSTATRSFLASQVLTTTILSYFCLVTVALLSLEQFMSISREQEFKTTFNKD